MKVTERIFRMVYYLKNDKIVARSYQTHKGYIFDVGTQFKKRNTFILGDGFFVTKHYLCCNLKELKKRINLYEKELSCILKSEDIDDSEKYAYIEKKGE